MEPPSSPSSSSSSSDPYAYTTASPLRAPSSSVFRVSDRCADDNSTTYRASFVSMPIEKPKSHEERVAEVAANNRSKLPFLERERHLQTDSRAHFVHHGSAYRAGDAAGRPPICDPSAENGGGTCIHFGHFHEPANSQHRASFVRLPLPRELTKEERLADIQRTRSGEAILKNFGKRPMDAVSTLEAGNRAMLASERMDHVPGAGGAPPKPGQLASDIAKTVSVDLGHYPPTHETDYRAHMVDYRAGCAAAENPYHESNRVHEVDPSAAAGGDVGEAAWVLRVRQDDGSIKEIHKVKSAIDFGHDDQVLQSVYMQSVGMQPSDVKLTSAGGWHANVTPFVPQLRPKFAANKSHPAVLAQQAAAAK